MATGRHRWRAMAAVGALAVIIALVVVGLAGRGPSPSGAAAVAPPSAGGPSSADVVAARACQAFVVYLGDARKGSVPAVAGRVLIDDAAALLRGATADAAAGRALPPWASLGSELLASAEDVVSHQSAALRTDGAAAAALCRTVPAPAARAGGFQRAG